MLRILHVVTYMGRGGLETMLMNYYRHMDRSKIQFDFLTHREYQAEYDEEILSLGGRIFHLPRLNPFSITYRKALSSFFSEHTEYKIVHVHQDCMSSVILKAAMSHGIENRIAHSHSAYQDKNIKLLIKLLYRRSIPKYSTELMACGEKAGQWMFRNASFACVNNAIEAEKYQFNPLIRESIRRELGIKENELLIGHVGRFSYPKNHLFLLALFAELQKLRPAKLMLVGDGEERNKIEQEIHNTRMMEQVLLMGIRTDVNELLQAMDVFVFPSLYEGFPLSLVEAQAAGLPCVISNVISSECIITDSVKQVSLSTGFNEWIRSIDEVSKTKRENTCKIIKQAGFDIVENAEKLQNHYLELANEGMSECLH